jgi:LL-diaminopimelate aminotransferase
VINREVLEEALNYAKTYGFLICYDNAYSEIYYPPLEPPLSILELEGSKEYCLEFGSLSKMCSMPGWRLGFVVGNEEVILSLRHYKENVDSGIFLALQDAAVVALKKLPEYSINIRKIYKERRDHLVSTLKSIGWEPNYIPSATFYLWLKTPKDERGEDFCHYFLDKYRILLSPGVAFGSSFLNLIDRYVRISYASLSEGVLEKLKKCYLKSS